MAKITVIGAGNVGATCAYIIGQKKLAREVVIYDIIEGVPQGKGLDMSQVSPLHGFDCVVKGTNDFKDTSGSDIVIMTAGLPRKPGMSREDLILANKKVIDEVGENIKETSPNAFIIVVTNPLDLMTYEMQKVTGFPKNKVIGQAGNLDVARFKFFISQAASCSVNDVEAIVLGGHGDSMVPVISQAKVQGKPLTEVLDKDTLDAIFKRTQKGGGEIVGLLKTGSAYYAPAAATVMMAESILKDKKDVQGCSAFITGQYGMSDFYIGVPCRLGKNGIEEIIELELAEDELKLLQDSGEIYKKALKDLS
ncbi:MAG: malate dehydrogenase [bacterium]